MNLIQNNKLINYLYKVFLLAFAVPIALSISVIAIVFIAITTVVSAPVLAYYAKLKGPLSLSIGDINILDIIQQKDQ